MKKTSLIVHQNYVEDVIKSLHEMGIMEIINISKEDSETLELAEKASTHPDSETCASYMLRLSRLIDILKKVKPRKSGIKGILNPDLPVVISIEDRSLDEIYSYAEGILAEIEKNILECDQKIQTQNEMIDLIEKDIKQIKYLKKFDINISYIGTSQYLIVKAGKTSDFDSLNTKLKDINKAMIYSKKFGSGKEIEWAIVIVAHISEKEKVEKICREHIIEFDLENLAGKPEELEKNLIKEKKSIIKEKKKITTDLSVYSKDQLDDLLALREEIYFEKMRKQISNNFAKTNSTYIINGWILEKDEKKLKEYISNITKDHVIINFDKPSVNPDNPPTHLKTPKWAESFRTFLELFATPRYNELNPTIFMGIFFVLFFGLMLGDAGYGLVILILSLFGYFKIGKNSPMLKTWSFLGIWLGLATTIFGLMMNSFFGDLLIRYFGLQLPSLIDPLKNPLIILMIALICGLIHLNLGIILGIIQKFHQRKLKSLITHHFCWIPLQLGGGLLIGSFLMGFSLDGVIFYFAIFLMAIGIILLMVGAGPIGFFDITGYLGDWLSYARLLALGLATTGMALAFNVVSELIGEMIPIIGIVITIILLIMSHLVNMVLQALGAGVHSLRLQYVEFFNRFYEGGGRNFSPFQIKRKYTKNEEKID
jgi:V/A-type H+-transporting ATPase subunit I